MPSTITLTADALSFSKPLTVYDDKGNVTTAAVSPTWTISDASIATIAPAADGRSVTVTLTGKVGTASLAVAVPVPSGTLGDSLTIVVTPGAPASVVIDPSQPPTPTPDPT